MCRQFSFLLCDFNDADQIFQTVGDGTFAGQTPNGLCVQPYNLDKVFFDAVDFQAPEGEITIVGLNIGDEPVTFDLYDANFGGGAPVQVPSHGVVSYVGTGSINH